MSDVVPPEMWRPVLRVLGCLGVAIFLGILAAAFVIGRLVERGHL